MKIIKGNFEKLFFTSCAINVITIDESIIILEVDNVKRLRPIDGIELGEKLFGKLIFKNIYTSNIRIAEYIGDPDNPSGFKDLYEIDDNFRKPADDVCKYEFEGGLLNPPGWIDIWSIQAESFEFHIEKDV